MDFHSFRHSFISNLERVGVSSHLRERLSRATAGVIDRYTHHELGEVMAIADQMPALDLSVLMDVELGISQGISRVVPK